MNAFCTRRKRGNKQKLLKIKKMKRFLLILCCIAGLVPLSAREVISLNGNWSFYFQFENGGDHARPVTLPHTWNIDALSGRSDYVRTRGNYERRIYAPTEWQGKHIVLRFGGVETVADLFVNGVHVGEHRGGHTAFAFDISESLRYGAQNTVVVSVCNAPFSDVLPTSSEHNIYGGIYRDVDLIVLDPLSVSPLHYGSDGVLIHQTMVTPERVEGTAEVHVLHDNSNNATLTLTMTDSAGQVAYTRKQRLQVGKQTVNVPFSFTQPRLWSPETPNLYRVSVTVENDRTKDEVHVITGFRSIEVDAQKGMQLNGVRCKVHGVTMTYDRPAVATVWRPADYEADFKLAREMGATAIRSPYGPHGQPLYDLCDSTGMIAWIDLPFMRAPFVGEMPYYGTETFEANGLQQLNEIIAQNINHPSVVLWGLFTTLRPLDARLNEYIGRLQKCARGADPSRPTVACSNQDGSINNYSDAIVWQQSLGWHDGQLTDVTLWMEQLHTYFKEMRSAVCYGAEGDPSQQTDLYDRPARFTVWLPERRQTEFHESYTSQVLRDTLLWSVWVNQLTDYSSARRADGRNRAGLVDFERNVRKDAFYLYKALWNRSEKTLYLAHRRWDDRPEGQHVIHIYSSCDERPELQINGNPVALDTCDYGACQYRSVPVELKGRTEVVVTADGISDRMTINCGGALKEPLRKDLLRTIGLPTIDPK